MITSVVSSTPYISVMMTSATTYIQNCGQMAGQVRYNTSTQSLEIYDGVSWISMPQQVVTISVDSHTLDILQWAYKKMQNEKHIEEYAKTHPAIQSALDHVRSAEQQLLVTTLLSSQNK